MDTDIDSFSVLPKTEAKILKISDCEYTDRPALFTVHSQLQRFLQILRAGFQQSLRGPFTFRQQYDIVCIADAWHAPPVKLPVEFIQIYIC